MIVPRLIRYRDAPTYLGVDMNRFDLEVRPELTEIPIGQRGIAFDRVELDAWADAYIADRGRPSRKTKGGMETCELGPKAFSFSTMGSGVSTSSTAASGSSSGSAKSLKMKPKDGSGSGKPISMPNALTNFEKAMSSCSQLQRRST
jgi:hypothetical protein